MFNLLACEADPLPEDPDVSKPIAGIGGGGSTTAGRGGRGGSGPNGNTGGQSQPSGNGGAGAPAANGGNGGQQAGNGAEGGNGGDGEAGQGEGGSAGDAGEGGQGGTGGSGGEPVEPEAGSGGAGPEAGSGGTGGTEAGSGGTEAGSGGGGSSGSGDPPLPPDELTFLSETDRSSDVVLSSDRLSAEWLGLADLGVRSTDAVHPRSGVFYFEAYANLDLFSIGVGPGTAQLNHGAASAGGFSIDVSGVIEAAQGDGEPLQRSANGEYGFVVDYRGDHPTVYLIAGTSNAPRLAATRTLSSFSAPLFIHLTGMRRAQGFQVTINPGNDTVNRPFVFDAGAVLQGQGRTDVAQALVLGWGSTHAGTWNEPPTLSLVGNPPSVVNVGDPVTLSATASDAEGGVGNAQIVWDLLSAGIGPEHEHGTGGSFMFTPSVPGLHPVQVSVTDAGGKKTQRVVTIEANGDVVQQSSVKLVAEPGLSGTGIQISGDGLRAHWTQAQKLGVRANQGLYGDFWYVEAHRLVAEADQAIGLVIGGVSLNPYPFNTTPPSCSVNTLVPSVFRNLMYAQSRAVTNVEYYGFAVDYRGDYPIVYVIMGALLVTTLHLTDVTVPIYPMLYGNLNTFGAQYDMEINFGGSAFHEDPVEVLDNANVDASGLKLCWGNANSACPH